MSEIVISTDKNALDIQFIFDFLTQSYWAKDRSRADVEQSIEHSLCFGAYLEGRQIGFARVATDQTIFAFIMDVFIAEAEQGNGYGTALMKHILDHSDLRSVQQWMLRTWDAHDMYKKVGFQTVERPDRIMEIMGIDSNN